MRQRAGAGELAYGGGGGGRGKVAIISGKVEPTSVFEEENAAPPFELVVEVDVKHENRARPVAVQLRTRK